MAHPLILIGLIGLGIAAIAKLTKKKKVFVSYYYRDDNRYKNLLSAWSANDKFDIEFEDVSADVSINSKDAAVLKRVLSRKIAESDVLLVLVGEKSYSRRWVRWEITKAKELQKRIVAVKVKPEYQSPKGLLSSGAVWARSFEYEAIKNAIEKV